MCLQGSVHPASTTIQPRLKSSRRYPRTANRSYRKRDGTRYSASISGACSPKPLHGWGWGCGAAAVVRGLCTLERRDAGTRRRAHEWAWTSARVTAAARHSRVKNVKRLLVVLLRRVAQVVSQAHARAAWRAKRGGEGHGKARRERAAAHSAPRSGMHPLQHSPPARKGLETLKRRSPKRSARAPGCQASRLPPAGGGG